MAKRTIVNFVVKHVQRRVPITHIPNAIAYRDAPPRRAFAVSATRASRSRRRVPPIHGRHDRAREGRCSRTATSSRTRCNARRGSRPSTTRRPASRSRRCLSITSSLTANVLCLLLEVGAHNVLITDPRDLPALVKLFAARVAYMTAVNTLFNALLHTPGRPRQRVARLHRRRHGRATRRRATLAGSHRHSDCTGLRPRRGVARRVDSPRISRASMARSACRFRRRTSRSAMRRATPARGAVGEICVRGPQVRRAIGGDPRDGARDADGGWLRTATSATSTPPAHLHRRPEEGRHRRVRLQGIPERDRGRRSAARCARSPPSACRTSNRARP